MPAPANGKTTAADLRVQPEGRWEVVRGRLVERPGPSFELMEVLLAAAALLRPRFHHAGGGQVGGQAEGPGGWWIVGGCELELDVHEVYRPELVGWRRVRVPERPTPSMTVRPDWICEVASHTQLGASGELLARRRVYELVEVRDYWLVDLDAQTLELHRLERDGYALSETARPGETVRAEPFAAVELPVAALFGG